MHRRICFLVSLSAFGQFETATLTGVVSDPAGAVVSNVSVKVANRATNVEAAVLTDEEGRYSFTALRPGTYNLTVSAPGFKQYLSSDLILQVNQSARVDVQLTVGQVSERVEVSAFTPMLETETSGRGAVIDQTKIVELPLNGRDYNQLALLSPGVLSPTPRLQSVGFRGAFNVNGNRAFNNAFQLDGVDNTSYSNSFRGLNVQVVQPSIEALQEFKIQTNAYSAEFGRSSGALINAVTRSGSNDVHGSLYEFHRNDNLDAANFFANKNRLSKPFRLRNQFGAAAGGRIVRDRTFIFGDYEGLRDRTGVVRPSSVPNPMWRQGIFGTPIHNPFNPTDTGQDFRVSAMPGCNDGSGNCWRIPANLIDPVGQRIINVAPDPNTLSPGVDNNYVSVPINRMDTNQFDLRLDHLMNQKISLFGRHSFVDTAFVQPAPRPGLAEGSTNDTFGTADLRSQGTAFGMTWVLTPAVVSETRFGIARGDYYQLPPNFGSGCPEQLIGLRGAPTDEAICGGLPVINFPGGNLRRLGRTTSVPQFQTPRSYNFRQSFAVMKGAHSIRAGGELLFVQTGIRDVSSLLGNFTFSGRFTGVNARWENAIADLLLGFPSQYQQDSNTSFDIYQRMYFGYLQDDWKVTRNLSLNLGLRYEFATPTRERDMKWANLDPVTRTPVQAKEGSLYDEALVHPDRNNWAPRVGFSWSPLARTVVRGGYGIFYNHSNRMGREGLLGFNPPFIVLRDANIAGSNALKANNAIFRLQDGIPAGFVDIARVDLATVTRKGQDPYQRTSYVQQYNVGIQQELAYGLLLDVAYVGNRGLKLPAFRNFNPIQYSFNALGAPVTGLRTLDAVGIRGDIQYLENIGISNYNSLQARLERRFSRGITFLASYTWGKALTDSVDHLSTSAVGNGTDVGAFREPQNPANRRAEYGPAEFDVTHRFVASGVWQLPFGFELSPIFTAQTGLALTPNQPGIINIGGERRSRPNRLADGNLPSAERTVDRWFDTSAFVPTTSTPGAIGFVPNTIFGNSGVGILRGPGYVNLDLNVAKTFPIREQFNAQLRVELFNAFNHTNFGVPGVTTGAGFGQIVSANDARIVQLALKLRF